MVITTTRDYGIIDITMALSVWVVPRMGSRPAVDGGLTDLK